jgi:hypothetical protein
MERPVSTHRYTILSATALAKEKTMKSFSSSVSLIVLATVSISCGNQLASQSSVIASDKYAVGNEVSVERILDARLRAQSTVYKLSYVHGTIPTGISLYDQSKLVDINGYQYLSADHSLIFSIGPVNETNPEKPYSEVLDPESKQPLGTLSYYPGTEGTSQYFELTELCTGAYEDTCTITFDPEALDYSIAFTQSETLGQ